MPDWIGKTIGKVRIEKYLSRGGMAEVYLGTHITLERRVAVKLLHSHIEEDPSLLARFQREAKVVAALRHSNIVQIFDFDAVDGHPFIVMEYLPGPSLSAYLRDIHGHGGRLPFIQIGRMLASLANALDYAHAQGVIHRDVKPANVLLHAKSKEIKLEASLPEDAEPVLTDFGLVRIAHSDFHSTSGTISGTPAYMSPEQAAGNQVDSRTDVYSLGIVLYEMLAGRVPFEADSTLAVLLKHINEPPPPIPGIPAAMQTVIDRALEKDADKRFQTCRELAADFLSAVGLSSQAETLRDEIQKGKSKAGGPKQTKSKEMRRILIGLGTVIGIFLLCSFASSIMNQSNLPSTEPPVITEPPIVEEIPTEVMISFPPAADGIAVGTLSFLDGEAALSQVTLNATLTFPPHGTQYEAWLVSDDGETRRSLGLLTLDEAGAAQVVFADAQARNLLDRFDRMEITLEPDPDDNPKSQGQVIYSSILPPESLTYVRNLIIRTDVTPSQVSLVHGLYIQVDLINQHTAAMLSAYESSDEANTRAYAEAVINLIAGNQDTAYYGDWDGNTEIFDPGDGYGALANGEQAGYINGTYLYADYAAIATDATAEIKMHAEHVKVAAQNVESWAIQLRDQAVTIVQAPFDENLDPSIRSAVDLSTLMLYGVDADGSQTIDPLPGESGTLTVYEHAYYLADMLILPGADQIPPPGQ